MRKTPATFYSRLFNSIRIAFLLLFVCVSSIPVIPAYAADVFYVGSSGGGRPTAEYTSYSLSQRFKDLVDFGAYGKSLQERSGKISGRFLSQINWQNVSGNKEKSTYSQEDTDHLQELNLSVQEKLWQDYQLDGEFFFRKTDNERIEARRDIRMKQMNVKILNEDNLAEFGDVYADFSQFVLGSSLEGFHAVVEEFPHQRYMGVAGRSQRADVAADRYQRNVSGGKADYMFFEDSDLFREFRIGAQAVTTQDDSSSAPETSTVEDLANSVASIDGDIDLYKYASLSYEIARSDYVADEDAITTDRQYGTAFRLQPAIKLLNNHIVFRYLYYYVEPMFYTEVGSASPDKQQHQFSLDLRLNSRTSLSLVENWYWDHLTGSSATKRTTYDEKYISLNTRPFESRDSFSIRPYFNHQIKNSDDPDNTAEADTDTLGIALNDTIWKTSIGPFYEYRAFDNKYDPTTSDYFHRFGVNASRDWMIFDRRFYLAGSISTDIRNTKQDPNKDANVNVSFNGSYALFKQLAARFGHNIQNTDSARPDSDFLNNKTFGELDYTIFPKRSTHLVTRYEFNRYNHEDGTQDYEERLLTTKFLTNF